jgi:eukaryotic-like serine/threonine-protein kinase
MGVVAKCTHLGLNEHVAIKMLRQDVMLDRDASERFKREAQAASKLKSEHVARVVDVGEFEDSGVPYMIMEFLDGHDLGDLVDDRGPLQAPFASMLMLMAAEALAEAHSIGIVHRDVKPSNLFVTWRPDGSALVKVLDFGISKSAMGTDLKLTQTQSLLGTPAYMSPEQMRSARLVDSRTDIWSLGTVFYELLEGRRPFEAESFSEMCVKVAVDALSPMVNAPPALQQIILRCLAKNPDQRYATMAELGRDLLPHVQDVHQASLLVERMQRILGRSRPSGGGGEQWEGPSSSTGVSRAPIQVRDPASAPVMAWQPEATPLPFSRALTPDPRAPDTTLREESKPAQAMSELLEVAPPPKKKSKVWLGVLAALVVSGVAVGAVIGTRGEDETPKVTAPQTPSTNDPVVKDTVKDTAPVVKAPDKPPIETKDQSGSSTPSDGSAAVAAVKPDDKIELDEPKPNPTVKIPKPTGRPRTPPVVVRKPPDKPPVHVPPVGEGSAKTVVTPPTTPPPPTNTAKQCSIMDRLPSGECPKPK